MLLYVIRHGQTDWNAQRRLQGQKDIPLNDIGRMQAAQNGRTLRGLVGDAEGFSFIASPLSRTRETMQIMRQAMGLDPSGYSTDERLVELSFGDWEGHTLKEVRGFSPEKLEGRTADKWSFIPPGASAESYEILSWRIGAWLQSLDGPTISVSHGGVIRSLFRLIGGISTNEAAELPIPQDYVLAIDTADGRMDWIN
ncbi:histidine phosphatase family protein [Neorhizobium lilium]|uniref:Histidine phosphatase family protein n=1 Tax=Neorhizobium lilium TaxID=2503024 RepID=A0A444LGA0_9HYPH|nr:histidine phosphatase family protein [Neorhizobium lilium]RWX77208.1 histidine phosphatase family protein [Neorhizobium lilium]